MPIFDEDGDVSWLERRTEPVPPPPPFVDPPERPLFAPDPPDGVPRRPRTPPPRPMPDAATPATRRSPTPSSTRLRRVEGGFWPFAGGTGHGETGSSLYAIGTEDGHVPGRSWLRLATGLAAVLLLVVAVVVAVNLQSGGEGTGPGEDDLDVRAAAGRHASPAPPGRSPASRPARSTRRATAARTTTRRRSPSTAAATPRGPPQSYFDQLGPGGLKTGVGLALDLGEEREVSSVDLRAGRRAHRRRALRSPTPRPTTSSA